MNVNVNINIDDINHISSMFNIIVNKNDDTRHNHITMETTISIQTDDNL